MGSPLIIMFKKDTVRISQSQYLGAAMKMIKNKLSRTTYLRFRSGESPYVTRELRSASPTSTKNFKTSMAEHP